MLAQWLATIRAYGYFPLKAIKQMMKLVRRTIKIFYIYLGLSGIVGAFGSIFLPNWFPPIPFLYQLTLGFFAITFVCLPPSVLLLGVSSKMNAALYYDIMWKTLPLKLIHMLNDFDFGVVY